MIGINSVIEFFLYLTLAFGLIAPITGVSNKESIWPLVISAISIGTFFIVAILTLYASLSHYLVFYNGLVIQDSFTSVILLGISITSIIFLVAVGNVGARWRSSPAMYSLIPLTLFGLFFLTGSNDALMLLASWLIVSLVSYIFVSLPDAKESKQAAIRYVMVGMIATLILIAWIAFLAITPKHAPMEFSFSSLLPLTKGSIRIASMAVLLFLAALGFKVGLFPFHWWLPQVYGRGDGRGISFVAGVIKLGFIAIIARTIVVFSYSIHGADPISNYTAIIVAVFAVATMIYGNISALTTRNFQMILSYSSMAHTGYIFAAIAAAAYFAGIGNPVLLKLALFAVALQTIAYGIAKTPLFAFVGDSNKRLSDLQGMLSSHPVAAVSILILLLSLLGVPPFMGFWGKVYLFISTSGYSLWLVLIALINSGISSVYYIIASREIVSKGKSNVKLSKTYTVALLIGAIAIIVLGIYSPFLLKSISSIYY
ncbi:MAG: NADH-quinone oxidoreductase subunit NuoN [Caldisphaeraceae archaeon]|nr:NADH-quinone oxidoreductase subunit NuoN [Caldisphaeraceae archaeon]